MKLQTMADIRADLTKAGYTDEFIRDVITARINKETFQANQRAKRAKDAIAVKRALAKANAHTELTKRPCPQQRADKVAVEPTPIQRGLILPNGSEW